MIIQKRQTEMIGRRTPVDLCLDAACSEREMEMDGGFTEARQMKRRLALLWCLEAASKTARGLEGRERGRDFA